MPLPTRRRGAALEPALPPAPEAVSGLGTFPSVSPSLTKVVSRTRLKQLDVLRAVAVLLVLCAHARSFEWLQRGGWIGVDLFFVLSGFLVSGLLYNEYKKHGSLSPKRFLLRRGLKIYPAFYAFVLGSVVLMLLARLEIPKDRLLAEILFVQNYYGGLWGHTWSLCIEEHFYILLTAAFYLLWRRVRQGSTPFDAIPKITIFIAVAALVARVLTHIYVVPFDFQTHFKPTHLRIDSLMFGVCLAYFHHFHHEKFNRQIKRYAVPILIFSLLALAPCVIVPVNTTYMSTVGFTLIYLGFGGALLLVLYFDSQRLLSVRRVLRPVINLLAWVGAYSYSIYLWHLVVASLGLSVVRRVYSFAAASLLPQGGGQQLPHHLVEFAIYVVGSVATGIIMAKLVEMPVLKLRDRFFPART